MISHEPILQFPSEVYAAIEGHLLQRPTKLEQAAFVFVRPTEVPGTFECVEWCAVPPSGFRVQLGVHFELTDDTKAQVIKRAHDLGASICELHSHVGPWKAQFSSSDWSGFEEIVPHVWWRLKGKPYFAIVVTQQGFDAITWIDSPETPARLSGIKTDKGFLKPSGLSPLNRAGYEWSGF